MSGGAQTQLYAVSNADQGLSGDPELFFFTSAYLNYTNFAIEAVQQNATGNQNFGGRFAVNITRSGPFVGKTLLEITLSALTCSDPDFTVAWAPDLAYRLFTTVELNIGAINIVRHWTEFYSMWDELTVTEEKYPARNRMIGQQNIQQDAANPDDVRWFYSGLQTPKNSHPATKLYFVPKFFNAENPGLYIPLGAMLLSQIEIAFTLRNANECYVLSPASSLSAEPTITKIDIYTDFVMVDPQVREAFKERAHQYLIKQLQRYTEGVNNANPKINTIFNNPCIYLIFAIVEQAAYADNQWNYWAVYDPVNPGLVKGDESVSFFTLKLNAQDRQTRRDAQLYSLVTPYYYDTRVPRIKGLYLFPFGLDNEAVLQPKGALNMTKIDRVTYDLELTNITSSHTGLFITYTENYNWFRVGAGIAGIVFG